MKTRCECHTSFSLLQCPQFQRNTQTCRETSRDTAAVCQILPLFFPRTWLLFIQDGSASSPRARRTFTAWRRWRGGLATPSPCLSPATPSTPSLTLPCPKATESDANWWTTTCSKNWRGREKWINKSDLQQQQPTCRSCHFHMSQCHHRKWPHTNGSASPLFK